MGTFSKIKKYSKPSQEIDEKIEYLDKELKKTLGEAITNSTSGVYSITKYTEPSPAVPPTYSDVPDVSGVTGNSFTQNDITNDNTGYNDISQLFNNDLGETPTPIIQTPPLTPSGGVGLVWHGYTLNGDAVGYIGPGNKFQQVLNPSIAGGTDTDYDGPGYFGGNYYTKMALRQSFASAFVVAPHRPYSMTAGTYITWQCWLPYNPYGFGALYNDYTGIKKTDAEGSWGLGNVIMGISRNTYQSDPGHPYQHGYTTLIQRYGLGDPNYYPGPVPPPNTNIAKGEVNWDLHNWYDKVYGLPAAEWYKNNPGKPPSSNPFLPKGAYVPLAMGGEVMNKLNMSQEAASTLISQFLPFPSVPSGPSGYQKPGTYDPNKFYNLAPGALPSPNIPQTGPGLSQTRQDTQIAGVPLGSAGMIDIDDNGWYVTPDQLLKMHQNPSRYNLSPKDQKKIKSWVTNLKLAHYEPQGQLISENKFKLQEKIELQNIVKTNNLSSDDILELKERVDALNKFIEENPEYIEYLQKRYPKNDPRLSQLNYKMDQMLSASNEYLETHFPENQKLFKKLQQSIKRNIKLTDPKTFKNVADTTTFKKLLSVDYVNEIGAPKKKLKLQNRNKKTAARFLKKPRIKTAYELIQQKIIDLENDMKKTKMS